MLIFFSIYLSKTVIKDFPNQTLDFKNCNSVWDFLHWIEWDIDIIHMMRHGIWDIDIVNMIYVMVYDIYTLRYKHEFFSEWMLTRNKSKKVTMLKWNCALFDKKNRIFQDYFQRCNIFHCVLFLSLCVWFSRVQSALECNRSMNLWQQHFLFDSEASN